MIHRVADRIEFRVEFNEAGNIITAHFKISRP